MMRKNLLTTIRRSMGRFIAIVAIVALGTAIFVGLRITKTDMVTTGQIFMDKQNMFDLRLISTYGWTQKDVDAVKALSGVEDAEGSIYLDAYGRIGKTSEDSIYRLHAIPDTVNQVHLLGGRMPEKSDECLVDGHYASDEVLGKKVTISEINDEDLLDSLNYHEYTVVGYVSTPLYMDMNRGSTSLGGGKVNTYLYLPRDAFNMDYFTEIYVTLDGDFSAYSEEFSDTMDAMADILEPQLLPMAQERAQQVILDAKQQLADGKKEYTEGLLEFWDAKKEVLQELEDALQKLQDGQAEIDENRRTLEDGQAQLEDGQAAIDENLASIAAGRVELEKQKTAVYNQLAQANEELLANYKTVTAAQRELRNGMKQLNDGLSQLEDGIAQIESGLSQIEQGLRQLDMLIGLSDAGIQTTQAALDAAKQSPVPNEETIARLEERLASQTAEREGLLQQRQELLDTQAQLQAQLPELQQQRESLLTQKAELEETQAQLEDALDTINAGFVEVEQSKTQADAQFAAAQAQLDAGELELQSAQITLNVKKAELEAGKQALEEAQAELDAGWEEYESGKAEAEAELAEVEAELNDAARDLVKAEEDIAAMGEPDVYVLTRDTNMGYMALDSNSDIVFSISKIFPVFFILIAALVCITTMTRMVDEERTQIGTLKALGYSRWSIMNKYLSYAVIATVAGCALGVLIGSTFFPWLLWNAYKILFNILPGVVMTVDWPLSIGIALAYTAVTALVTWYCCRRELKEVPAELIRPKAPTSGKKIFLEYLPFWNRIGFLNKVTTRNIFRYRQRLLMMLVGIGGCTALLVTGFGLRDSVMGIAEYHFGEVALYSMEVYFSGGQSEEAQEAFREKLGDQAEQVGFFHQSSGEISFRDQLRDIYVVIADDSIESFISFHDGEGMLTMPGEGEALLSIGMAEMMGIDVGDSITVRNSDREELTVTVSGIYDNNVYNYVIVTPETAQARLGYCPESQMAYVLTAEGRSDHAVSAAISKMDGVMNVSVSEDLLENVNSMLEAMNMLIATIVIFAGLLAATVLYNLTNINIKERIREIATIKVLGFRAEETGAYVFKENIVLTVMGMILGLPMGKLLLEFVMANIKIDMVWFSARIGVLSYVFAAVLTIVCAVIVDMVFYRKLDEINMAEALKSVE
ncbi:MAG: FtsX-like permease family protein [Faecousia sp.]